MTPSPEQLARARAATEPRPGEVDALLRRLRTERPSAQSWARPLPILVALAAVLAFALLMRPGAPSYGPAPAPGTLLSLSAHPVLGPSIALEGRGRIEVLAAGPDGTRVRLQSGRLEAEVDPEGPFRDFTIHAPGEVTVRVVGTHFVVAYDDTRGGEVRVTRGKVAVEGPDGARSLVAGQSHRWSLAPPPEPSAAEEPPSGTQGTAEDPTTAGSQAAPVVASSPAAGGESAPPVSGSQNDAVTPPVAAQEPEAVASLTPPAPAERPGTPSNADSLAYLRLQNAAPADAMALADVFLLRYPDSRFAPDVMALQVETLSDLRPAEALALAESWLAAHPEHLARPRFLALAAALARDRFQDCARALPLYVELAPLQRAEPQATSLAYAGLCAAGLRDPDARSLLDSALAHPDLPSPFRGRLRGSLRSLPKER